MSFYELFSHADRFPHRAHIVSSATTVICVCTALTFLSPFLLTYYTDGFWMTESVYSEQPRLNSSLKYILMVDTDSTTSYQVFMSSYFSLNRDFIAGLIFGKVTDASSDTDGDGLIDQFRVSFDVVFPTSTTINCINIWLAFQYELRNRQRIRMETLGLISFVPPSSLTFADDKNITIYGQLKFEQRQAIRNSGSDSTYNRSIINLNSSLALDLNSVLNAYFARKYYTNFQTQYVSITPQSPTGLNRLFVTAVVNIGRESIRFIPGFWEAFKWGWIQYICALLSFMFVFNRLKLFVFTNQHVRTSVPLSTHRHKE